MLLDVEKSADDLLHKTCMIGLSYFDIKGNLLKQSMLGGHVIALDKENGITVSLASSDDKTDKAQFIIPSDLRCWFVAPKGEFHTSGGTAKLVNPDYLVTWDIHQTKADKKDLEQQWWQWRPNTVPPQIG